MRERVPETTLNPKVAGRFYVGTDGGFNADQYTDMIMTELFESAKDAPMQLKVQMLEFKLQAVNIIHHFVHEAMMDSARRVGRNYELNDKKQGRLLLPGGLAGNLDSGSVWSEASALSSKE